MAIHAVLTHVEQPSGFGDSPVPYANATVDHLGFLELAVHFLDHEGNEIEHEEEGEEHDDEDKLQVSENDANVAVVEVEHHENGEEDEEHHGMELHIIGVSTGTTSFMLQLMHEGHADYTSSNNVPVIVN